MDSIDLVPNTSSIELLRCPECGSSLRREPPAVVCENDHGFPLEDGVIRFRSRSDAFYEGRYARHVRHVPGSNPVKDWIFFHLVQGGIFGEIRRECHEGAVVLDVGCAGGIRWLGRHGRAIGIDLSLSSLTLAAPHYDLALEASVDNLPLADESVEVAYSSFLFEHLEADLKDKALKEMFRVLVPGGKLVIQLDSLSRNRIMSFARRDPDTYRHAFIDHDQHLGLEPLGVFLDRVSSRGFIPIRCTKFGTTWVQYLSVYQWLANGYAATHRWVRLLELISRGLKGPLHHLYDFFVTAFYRAINLFSRSDMATGAIVVARKRPI